MKSPRTIAPKALSTLLARRLEGSIAAIGSLEAKLDDITAAADAVVRSLASGGLIATAGNGGSAAQALHLAEELIGRYRSNRRPLASVCLNTDATALTCIANDFSFYDIFSRQV